MPKKQPAKNPNQAVIDSLKKTVTIEIDKKQAQIVSMALRDRAHVFEKLASACAREKQDVAAKAIIADLRELNKVQAAIDLILPRGEDSLIEEEMIEPSAADRARVQKPYKDDDDRDEDERFIG